VQPPSAGFILQLFIVPGVIVVVVVMIWVMFSWLAQKGNDRDAFVRALGRNNEARWQAAFNLANALRVERTSTDPTLKTDAKLAQQLAAILNQEIETGNLDKNSLSLRIYLCLALGEFKVADGMAALVKAATTERDPKEADVRRAALEGLALLASNLPDTAALQRDPSLEAALHKAADEEDPRMRSLAAMALGSVGGENSAERLKTLLADFNPDVRYNAAARLAALGDAASIDVLVEMLDQSETAGVDLEKQPELRSYKRDLINNNALRAAKQLARKNSVADLSKLQTAVEQLLSGRPNSLTRVEADEALRALQARAAQKPV